MSGPVPPPPPSGRVPSAAVRPANNGSRDPLSLEAQRQIVAVLRAMQQTRGVDAARADPRYRSLLRLLRAHSKPLAGSNFTFPQLQALRIQILIFNHFKSGTKLPKPLRDGIFSGLAVGRTLAAAPVLPPAPESSSAPAPADVDISQGPPVIEERRLPVRRPTAEQAAAQHLATGSKPAPMLPAFIAAERERILARRLAQEKEKISLILGQSNVTSRERLLCEARLRQMRLLSLQQSVRGTVYAEKLAADRDGKPGSRSREKATRSLQREADKIERLRTRQLEQAEKEKRRAQQAWMNAMADHSQKFKQFHRDTFRRNVRQISRAVAKYHEDVGRNAERAAKEAEKLRIRMLREDNEEGYMELVRKTKNKRLTELLDQTDSYLKELGALVTTVQADAVDEGGDQAVAYEGQDNIGDLGADGKKITYYEVAHKIKEEITTQPDSLEGGTLKEYQMQGLQWMVSLYNNKLNGILADEMGLGKTVQTIALLSHLQERKQNNGPFLVLVPLSTMSNWEAEFKRWNPRMKCVVYKGDKSSRKRLFDTVLDKGFFNVCLATFEYAVRGKNFLRRIEWQYIIVDEGHRMKNAESRLSSVLGDEFKSRNRLLLTGTPLQNNLAELWALLNFLLPTVFDSADTFESWFAAPLGKVGAGNEEAGLTEEENLLIIRRLHQVLRPFVLRRLKADVLKMGEKLPAKQEDVILCDMSAWQKYMYTRVAAGQKMLFTDIHGHRRYNRLANRAMQLRKVANHPYLFFADYANDKEDGPELWRCAGKFDMLDACLTKFIRTGHRVLIFNQMTKVLDLQEQLLQYRGIPYFRLDGSTTHEARKTMVNDFNDDNSKTNVFLLTTRAGGLGVNLQTADTVIIFDSDWNPQADLQAQDRAHRIGQKREVRILRFITTQSVEQNVMERAELKRTLEATVIKGGKFDGTSTEAERDRMLQELVSQNKVNDSENEDELPTNEEINRVLCRTEEEFELFCQIDRERKAEIGNLPTLMCEAELPRWFTDPSPDEIHKGLEITDLFAPAALPSKRKQSTARYAVDNLTDDQYLTLVQKEADGISYEDAEQSVKPKRAKRPELHNSPRTTTKPPRPPMDSPGKPAKRSRGRPRKLKENETAAVSLKRESEQSREDHDDLDDGEIVESGASTPKPCEEDVIVEGKTSSDLDDGEIEEAQIPTTTARDEITLRKLDGELSDENPSAQRKTEKVGQSSEISSTGVEEGEIEGSSKTDMGDGEDGEILESGTEEEIEQEGEEEDDDAEDDEEDESDRGRDNEPEEGEIEMSGDDSDRVQGMSDVEPEELDDDDTGDNYGFAALGDGPTESPNEELLEDGEVENQEEASEMIQKLSKLGSGGERELTFEGSLLGQLGNAEVNVEDGELVEEEGNVNSDPGTGEEEEEEDDNLDELPEEEDEDLDED